ncbi:unnamed protein product [Rotaria sp. Silwood2]|nr:unnamed protein product [Rotaria sp. Silwood2]CAF4182475.1 unnamed protein product [Rotaria sp. Silwood2]
MKLESLPNEILLDLFEYFSTIQLLRAFNDLNSRFNQLLFDRFRVYHLNFRSISRYDYQILFQQHLPLIIDRISSLRLSDDDDDSPQQIDLFFSHNMILRQFINLRALTLCGINSQEAMNNIIIECHDLPYLTHLKIVKCDSVFERMNAVQLFNSIWSLPRLTDCRLNIKENFHIPTTIVPSLEHLSIQRYYCPLNELNRLFEQTPHIQSLCLLLNHLSDHQCLSTSVPSISSLKLCDVRSRHAMFKFLTHMPNLNRLIVETNFIKMDGQQWEDIIVNCLPKLNVFRLKMRIQYYGRMNNEQEIDTLLDSFRSQFWLEKHQWFVRCHRKLMIDYSDVLLYTFPQTFAELNMDIMNISYKSTCPYDQNFGSCQQVRSLIYKSFLTMDLTLPHIYFSNIRHLSVHLPVDNQFWTVVKNLDQLTSLSVSSIDDNADHHLQILLDKAHYLYSLEITSWPSSLIPLVSNTSRSVRRLDLRQLTICYQQHSNSSSRTQIYRKFGCSRLGTQCEVLRIATESEKDILTLVNKMINIRILYTTCTSDKWKYADNVSSSRKSEIIERLKSSLPSTTTIKRVPGLYGFLQLWFR